MPDCNTQKSATTSLRSQAYHELFIYLSPCLEWLTDLSELEAIVKESDEINKFCEKLGPECLDSFPSMEMKHAEDWRT